jgi:opacity protein-like surface antigen
MKKIKLLSILIFLSAFILSGFSQTTQGKIFVGGTSSFGLNAYSDKWKNDDDNGIDGKGFNATLNPIGGFFIIDNLVVGVNLQLGFNRYKEDNTDNIEKYSNTYFGPFGRYYFDLGKIKPYGHFGFGGGMRVYKYDPNGGSTSTYKYGVIYLQIGGGASFFINDNIALDLSLMYQRTRSKAKQNNDNNERDNTASFGLTGGVIALF